MNHDSAIGNRQSALILGIGNPQRGDDGVGPAVIEWLRGQSLPANIMLVDGGTSGLDIISHLMDRQCAIIVDAANLGCAPGEWQRFTPDAVRWQANDTSLSLHSAGLAEALALAAALKVLPEEVIIYGVQPARVDWSSELSDAVRAAVPVVGQAVLRECHSEERLVRRGISLGPARITDRSGCFASLSMTRSAQHFAIRNPHFAFRIHRSHHG